MNALPPRWILQSRQRAWLGYALVVGLLFVTTMGLVRQELRHNLDAAREATQRELKMVGSLVADALRRGQYQSLNSLLQDWAMAKVQLTELRVIAPDGLVLGTFHRGTAPSRALNMSLPIDYSYRERATLSLQLDLTPVYELNEGFRNKLLFEMSMLSGLLGAVLFLLLKRQEQTGALQRHAAALDATNESLRISEQRFRSVLESMELLGVMLDREGHIILCNDYLLGLTGHERGEVLHRSWFYNFLPPDIREQTSELDFLEAIQNGQLAACCESEIVTRMGDRRLIAWNNTVFRDPQGQVANITSIGEDITERKRAERELAHLALYDALTDLPNRQLLYDRLAQAILVVAREGGACALLIIDLDSFKEINDTLGHTVGDALLKLVALRLRGCLRDTDTLARQGGDEFAMVLSGADQLQAERMAYTILTVFETPFDIDGMATRINVSIGIAQYPQHGQSPDELLRHADVAMCIAKQEHGGYALHVPKRDPHSRVRLALSAEFNNALERGELELYYQPILRLRDHALIGMEALTRWHHPLRGFLLPREFIPHMERQRLIRQHTLWAIESAARQSAQWRASGLDIPIAVNLSPKLLRDSSFVRETLVLLDNNDAVPWLELEMTENALMENPVLVLELLAPLRLRGVRLSIDDFGTGYSSLAYLRGFQADTLKIDQTFIHDMTTSESSAIIVRAVIQLAHNLGMQVIAEGVENQETYDRLCTLGCDAAQGYHLGRPMPAGDCLPWVDEMLARHDRKLIES